MARYCKDFPVNGTPEQMYGALCQYLMSEGYEQTQYKGENVLKKGNGWLTGPTIFKVSFFSNIMRVESWMAFAILPGVFAGEIGPDGFVGWAVKGPWKQRLTRIEQMFLPANPYAAGPIPAYIHQAAGAVTNACNQGVTAVRQAVSSPAAPAAPQQAPAEAASRFCTNCGAPVQAGSAFCSVCGSRIQ